jgi:hypothetical protein
LKSGSLNLQESSVPVQVSTGIALPFYIGRRYSRIGLEEYIWDHDRCVQKVAP